MTDSAHDLIRAGEAFTSGSSRYFDTNPELPEDQARIYIKFRPGGLDGWFLGLLDTGAHFCILNEPLVHQIEDQLTDFLGKTSLQTARGPIHGDLYLLEIVLIAEHGEDLAIDTVVFIAPEWQGPNFVGYSGVLDRTRFAIDPEINLFYFGRLA